MNRRIHVYINTHRTIAEVICAFIQNCWTEFPSYAQGTDAHSFLALILTGPIVLTWVAETWIRFVELVDLVFCFNLTDDSTESFRTDAGVALWCFLTCTIVITWVCAAIGCKVLAMAALEVVRTPAHVAVSTWNALAFVLARPDFARFWTDWACTIFWTDALVSCNQIHTFHVVNTCHSLAIIKVVSAVISDPSIFALAGISISSFRDACPIVLAWQRLASIEGSLTMQSGVREWTLANVGITHLDTGAWSTRTGAASFRNSFTHLTWKRNNPIYTI